MRRVLGRGFTLLEIMIGITLLVLVVLPLASLYAVSLSTIQSAALYSQALQLARDRMEWVQVMDYGALNYEEESLAPGFQFRNRSAMDGQSYFRAYNPQRDDPSTDNFVEESYDPTDTDGEGYPVPVYRDYYSNFTGELLDPNFNGLCDDDLNGDGLVDILDERICNPNGDTWVIADPAFAFLDGQPRAGDGLYDTVVEGLYIDSYDVLFGIRAEETNSPLQDLIVQYDHRRYGGLTPYINQPFADYEHRNRTFDLFVRMTSIIDPTPRCGNPNISGTLLDQRYLGERIEFDNWNSGQIAKFIACMDRDLPIWEGTNTLTIGPHRTTDNPTVLEAQWRQQTGYNKSNAPPRQGKKVIVRVLYLSGEGDRRDVDGDGFPDGESLGTARQVVLERMVIDPARRSRGNPLVTGADGVLDSIQAPQMKIAQPIYENIGEVVPDVVGDDWESDFCSLPNDGLPYYDVVYFANQ